MEEEAIIEEAIIDETAVVSSPIRTEETTTAPDASMEEETQSVVIKQENKAAIVAESESTAIKTESSSEVKKESSDIKVAVVKDSQQLDAFYATEDIKMPVVEAVVKDEDDDDDDDEDFEILLNDSASSRPLQRFTGGANRYVRPGAGNTTTPAIESPTAAANAVKLPDLDISMGDLILPGGRKTAFDVDLDKLEETPWRKPGIDISDYFNYGFDETSWRGYCVKQNKIRRDIAIKRAQDAAARKTALAELAAAEPKVAQAVPLLTRGGPGLPHWMPPHFHPSGPPPPSWTKPSLSHGPSPPVGRPGPVTGPSTFEKPPHASNITSQGASSKTRSREPRESNAPPNSSSRRSVDTERRSTGPSSRDATRDRDREGRESRSKPHPPSSSSSSRGERSSHHRDEPRDDSSSSRHKESSSSSSHSRRQSDATDRKRPYAEESSSRHEKRTSPSRRSSHREDDRKRRRR